MDTTIHHLLSLNTLNGTNCLITQCHPRFPRHNSKIITNLCVSPLSLRHNVSTFWRYLNMFYQLLPMVYVLSRVISLMHLPYHSPRLIWQISHRRKLPLDWIIVKYPKLFCLKPCSCFYQGLWYAHAELSIPPIRTNEIQIRLRYFLHDNLIILQKTFTCTSLFLFWTPAAWKCQAFPKDSQGGRWFLLSPVNPVRLKWSHSFPITEVSREKKRLQSP